MTAEDGRRTMQYEIIDKDVDGFRGQAWLIELSDPVKVVDRVSDEVKAETEYFAVSASVVLGKPETYVFPTDEDGEVLSWSEVAGSRKGTSDQESVAQDFLEAITDGEVPG